MAPFINHLEQKPSFSEERREFLGAIAFSVGSVALATLLGMAGGSIAYTITHSFDLASKVGLLTTSVAVLTTIVGLKIYHDHKVKLTDSCSTGKFVGYVAPSAGTTESVIPADNSSSK